MLWPSSAVRPLPSTREKTGATASNRFIRFVLFPSAEMRPVVLVVQNAEWEGPGLIDLYARAAGLGLATAELFRESTRSPTIPFEELEKGSFSAVVALGSPSTAYLPESNPHHDELVRLFKLTRKRGIPSFNICYSMQLFSVAHGGRVIRNPAGKEVGFGEVRPTPEGKADPVIGPIGPYTTLQWHGDIVEVLPKGAVLLASSKKTQNEVAVLDGIHYLVQADGQAAAPSMIRSWLRHDAKWATLGTGLRTRDLVGEAVEHEAYLRNTFLRIFGNFVALVLSRETGSATDSLTGALPGLRGDGWSAGGRSSRRRRTSLSPS